LFMNLPFLFVSPVNAILGPPRHPIHAKNSNDLYLNAERLKKNVILR
jgi:hypothetical protein